MIAAGGRAGQEREAAQGSGNQEQEPNAESRNAVKLTKLNRGWEAQARRHKGTEAQRHGGTEGKGETQRRREPECAEADEVEFAELGLGKKSVQNGAKPRKSAQFLKGSEGSRGQGVEVEDCMRGISIELAGSVTDGASHSVFRGENFLKAQTSEKLRTVLSEYYSSPVEA